LARWGTLILKSQSLRRKALLLVWIGELWNILEAVVALWAALLSSSVALLAFGLDSLIELFAGAVLIWRFWKEKSDESSTERKALRLVGATFFLLSAFIVFQSTTTILGYFREPQVSFVGVFITISSAVLMTILFVFKTNIAQKLGSRALRAEAYESLICDLQDLIVLAGLGLNILLGWWWADPIVALALIPFLIKEGIEAFREEED
jgi:divalent metal cation (Fe/Co/Zn/Cd) transporter